MRNQTKGVHFNGCFLSNATCTLCLSDTHLHTLAHMQWLNHSRARGQLHAVAFEEPETVTAALSL